MVGSSPRNATQTLRLKYSGGRLVRYSCSALPLNCQCCSIRWSQYGVQPPSPSTWITLSWGHCSKTPNQISPAIAAIASKGCDKICPLVWVSMRSPKEGTEAEAESCVDSGLPTFSISFHSGQ